MCLPPRMRVSIVSVDLPAGCSFNFNAPGAAVTVTDAVSVSNGGTITFDASGSGGSLSFEAALSTDTGILNLFADDGVSLSEVADITSAGGAIVIDAGVDNDGIGDLKMADGTVIDAGDGQVTLSADGDIELGSVRTTCSDFPEHLFRFRRRHGCRRQAVAKISRRRMPAWP